VPRRIEIGEKMRLLRLIAAQTVEVDHRLVRCFDHAGVVLIAAVAEFELDVVERVGRTQPRHQHRIAARRGRAARAAREEIVVAEIVERRRRRRVAVAVCRQRLIAIGHEPEHAARPDERAVGEARESSRIREA
jgi:hypothetical protein